MSKSVLISIQPYWVFLIIAKKMGWNIGKEKMVEIRKNYPKAETWDKTTKIYCSRDKKSFARIPKEYQTLMERLLGKVIGEFMCDAIFPMSITYSDTESRIALKEFPFTCMTDKQIIDYLGNGKEGYAWHISDLKIYDKPRELSEFYKPCVYGEDSDVSCFLCDKSGYRPDMHIDCFNKVTRPPQSWCYVEVT